jgi:hypothetical protein
MVSFEQSVFGSVHDRTERGKDELLSSPPTRSLLTPAMGKATCVRTWLSYGPVAKAQHRGRQQVARPLSLQRRRRRISVELSFGNVRLGRLRKPDIPV